MSAAYRSHTFTAGSPNTITINKPAGVVDGDLLLATLSTYEGNGATTVTAPSGWVLLDSGLWRPTNDSKARLYYKFALGEPASWTWTLTSGSTTPSGDVSAYSGVQAINAQVKAFTTQIVGMATVQSSAVTTTVDGCLLVHRGYFRDSAATTSAWTDPVGYTLDHGDADSTFAGYEDSISKTQTAAGTNSPEVWKAPSGLSMGGGCLVFTLALAPPNAVKGGVSAVELQPARYW